MRGKGYGKELLNRSVKIYLGNKKRILRAIIKENNIPSFKLFSSLGFLIDKKENGIIHMVFKEKLIFKKVYKKKNIKFV